MSHGDMGFLDALGVLGGHVQGQVHAQLAAGLAGEGHAVGAAQRRHPPRTMLGLVPLVERPPGRRRGRPWIPPGAEKCIRSPGRGGGGEHRSVGGKGQGREARAIGMKTYDEFGGEVLRVGGASTIAEEDHLAARGGALRRNARQRFRCEPAIPRAFLYAAAFTKLGADVLAMDALGRLSRGRSCRGRRWRRWRSGCRLQAAATSCTMAA